jgi:dUTP pyrophosphatase
MKVNTLGQSIISEAVEIIAKAHGGEVGAIQLQVSNPIEVKFVEESFDLLPDEVVEHVRGEYLKAATEGSAGIDLRYLGAEPLVLAPGETRLIPTGLAIFLRDPEYVGKAYPRSGLGVKGLVLGNLTGIIDSDYQQEIKLCLWNRNPEGGQVFEINPGERVAQYVIERKVIVNFEIVEGFSSNTGRGGFGSSGLK